LSASHAAVQWAHVSRRASILAHAAWSISEVGRLVVEHRREVLLELHACAVQSRLVRADFDADDLGGVLRRQTFDVAQDQRLAALVLERAIAA
jgi:hypothetical protein